MKKLSIIPLLLLVTMLHAQEGYFTMYNFSVAPKNVSTVYQLVNDYYSKNKSEGVSVYLYENHFNDSENNFTHSRQEYSLKKERTIYFLDSRNIYKYC